MGARRTLARAVELSGYGVHTGAPARVRLVPAPVGAGRVIATAEGDIPVDVAFVAATEQRTALRAGPAEAATVEHLLSACAGLGLDDVRIELDGPEAPILDGSAAPWVEALTTAGLVEQGTGGLTPLRLERPVEIREGERFARLEPAERFELDITIDFPHPAVGRQRLVCAPDATVFAAEIAPARTFGFLADLDRLRAHGLALGAGLDNTVAYDADGLLNPEGLRFPDEAVRHKALDVIGDLALLGRPIEARLIADRPGHTMTIALVRAVRAATR